MEDVFVHLIDLHGVHEAVTENQDGSFSIFIDKNLSYDDQVAAYIHAMGHIYNRDFEKGDVQEIEYTAHGLYEN